MDGWRLSSLADVCDIQSALVDPREDQYFDLPHIGAGNIESSTGHLQDIRSAREEQLISGKFLFDDSMILYSKIRPYLMKVVRPDFSGLCSADIYPLAPKPGCVEKDFLYYLLLTSSFTEYAIQGSARAGMPKVNREHLFAYKTCFPPIGEQRRIVAILDEAFEGIATAKANAEKNLLNAELILQTARRDKFSTLASKFSNTTLGAQCEFENGDRGKNYPGKQHRVAAGIPFINAGHLTEDGIDFESMDYISPERFGLLGNGKIRPNDILFCLRGSLGKFASVGSLAHGAIASSLVILRPGESIKQDYLLAFLGSNQCSNQVERFKGGAAQPNLGAKDLKNFELPIPPLDVQTVTMERLSELQESTRTLKRIQAMKLASLAELKKSLLHQAFSGALTSAAADRQIESIA